MTLDEFFAKLEQTPRDWFLDHGVGGKNLIRRVDGRGCCEMCPLSSLLGLDVADFDVAADRLQIHGSEAGLIVGAADDLPDCDPELRQRLLKACGLS